MRAAIDDVLEGGQFVFGPNVSAFEEEAARYLGVRETIGVANGTDALVLVLNALEIGQGAEVICPAFTFYATAEAIARVGATPVFADIDPQTLNLDPERVAERITPRTKAIMPVHLFGRPAPLARLSKLGLPLIEDAAQAFGSSEIAGAGVASTFSFYPTKNLFGLGDGGLVAVNDPELAERIRMLRFHGSKAKRIFEYVGTNSRLDEIQAAALRIFLRELDCWTALRRQAADRYRELGLGRACDVPADEPGHVYHLFVSRSPRRDEIRAALAQARHRQRRLLRAAPAPPAAHCGTWATRRATFPRRSARRRRTSPCRSGPASRPSSRSASSRPCSLRHGGPRRMRSPVNRHRLWQVGVDAVLVAAAWILSWYVRFDAEPPLRYQRYLDWEVVALVVGITIPVFVAFGFYNRWWRYVSTRDMWGAVRGVAVAVIAVFVVFSLLGRDLHTLKVPRGIWIIELLLLLAFVMGSRLLARTVIERPSAGSDRRARQGGHHRRRRGRSRADPARDASDAVARIHADRPRRRRSAEEEPPAARRSRPRDDRGALERPPGPQARRAAHRDPLRVGRDARARRRDRACRGRAREDPARARAR